MDRISLVNRYTCASCIVHESTFWSFFNVDVRTENEDIEMLVLICLLQDKVVGDTHE